MKQLLTFSLVLSAILGLAQDQIFKRDNSKVLAKIIEINPTQVKYKLFDYQNGPLIILNKDEVALIIYQNGSHEVFNPKPVYIAPESSYEPISKAQIKAAKKQEESELFDSLTKNKNLISFNILEPMNGCIGISYLKEFTDKHLQFYTPLIIGFGTPYLNENLKNSTGYYRYNFSYISDFTFTKKVFETGAGIHFVSSSKKVANYFIGPYIGIAQYNGTFNENIYLNNGGYYLGYTPPKLIQHGFVMNRYYFLLNNGVIIRTTKHFNFLMNAALGYYVNDFVANNPNSFSNFPNRNYNTPVLNIKLGFSVGYRF